MKLDKFDTVDLVGNLSCCKIASLRCCFIGKLVASGPETLQQKAYAIVLSL